MNISDYIRDDYRLKLLEWLKKEAKAGRYWHNANEIALGTGHSWVWTNETLRQLLLDGWLLARDGDTQQEKILYRLKPEYC